jgi:hypothetical protein
MATPREIWYLLVNNDGTPYMDTSADIVVLPSSASIVNLKKSIKAENADGLLQGISPAQLKVYASTTTPPLKSQTPLENCIAIDDLGTEEKSALLVNVPTITEVINRPANVHQEVNHQEANFRMTSEFTETYENLARNEIQGHLYRLFRVGYPEDIGLVPKGVALTNYKALGFLKQLYPNFKRRKSKEVDILLYLEKPAGGWHIDGNDSDCFVSIGYDDDFETAMESLNKTRPVDQLTPPPSQEDLTQDSTLGYNANASYYALFEVILKKNWHLNKMEQLELQLAYMGLKYLVNQDSEFERNTVERKHQDLASIVPRLVAFAGFVSMDSYDDISKQLDKSINSCYDEKTPLNESIGMKKFPLLQIFYNSGRLVYSETDSPAAELMRLRNDVAEVKTGMAKMETDVAETKGMIASFIQIMENNKN